MEVAEVMLGIADKDLTRYSHVWIRKVHRIVPAWIHHEPVLCVDESWKSCQRVVPDRGRDALRSLFQTAA